MSNSNLWIRTSNRAALPRYVFRRWARAMEPLLFCRALIFCDENKGLIEIGTFYFNRALIS
jgi:hypothetical protein